MKVSTAIIFASGFGSRMLPVTSAVQKELLPILDRPIIDYVVSDCLAAGINHIIFVIRPNSHAMQDYYTGNPGLQAHLQRFGKTSTLQKLAAIHESAVFNFVEQPESAGYGSAVPLQVAIPHLGDTEGVVVCNGDAFLWRNDGESEVGAMIKRFHEANAEGAIMTMQRPDSELHKYGVLSTRKEEGHEFLADFVEKPAPGDAPSNLINLGMYIMTPEILKYVETVEANETGELYVTDAVLAAAQEHKIVVHTASGQFLDGGNVASWLHANLTVAASRPDLASHLEALQDALTKTNS